jgi:hypothetical protein
MPLFIEYEAVLLRPAHLKAARVSSKAVIPAKFLKELRDGNY